MQQFSKLLIFAGILLIALGVLIPVLSKFAGIGKLPGDIYFKKGSFIFYFPIATSLILSLVLTVIFSLFGKK